MQPRKRVRKDGTVVWDARWIGMDGREKSKACPTQREAKRYAAERTAEVEDGVAVEGAGVKQPLSSLAASWTAQADSEGTRIFRRQLEQNLGFLGGVPLFKLKPSLIRAWHNELRAGRSWVPGCTGVSDNYRINLLAQLRAMLSQAVEDELLARNPAGSVRAGVAPDASVSPHDLPTAGQVAEMVRLKRDGGPRRYYVDDSGARRYRCVQRSIPMSVAIRVLAATGMRVSECAGLEWSKVDFDAGTIRVDVQAHRYDGTLVALKTRHKGKRTVSVDVETMRALRELHALGLHESRVFVTNRGKPANGRDIYQAVKTVVEYMGLGVNLTPKTLRHFHASVLLSKGVSVKVVQHRLGHVTPMHTLTTYAHMMPSDDSDAAVLFAESVFSRDTAPKLRVIDGDLAG